jgi:hypothetical protein
MKISKEPSPLEMMIDQKLANAEYFNQLHSIKLDSGLPKKKQHLTGKKALFISKLDLNLRKKLIKCCIWIVAFYGSETWDASESRPEIPGKF